MVKNDMNCLAACLPVCSAQNESVLAVILPAQRVIMAAEASMLRVFTAFLCGFLLALLETTPAQRTGLVLGQNLLQKA